MTKTGMVLIAVVLLGLGFFMLGGKKVSTQELKAPALSACKGFVEKYMPGVEFDQQSPMPTEETPGIYSIEIFVKAPTRNFIAKCIMRYEDPGWKLISLKELE